MHEEQVEQSPSHRRIWGGEGGLSIRTIIDIVGSGAPDTAAIAAPGKADLTRTQLITTIQALCVALRRHGVGRRDTVASALQAGADGAVVFLAAASAAVSAPLDPSMPASELARWLDDVQPKLLILGSDANPSMLEAAGASGVPVASVVSQSEAAGHIAIDVPGGEPSPDDLDAAPDDVALLLHTSGTTARPKRVPIRHRNIVASARNIATTLDLGPENRCLDAMPLFHIHGLMAGLLAPLAAGGSVVCPPAFNGAEIFRWISATRPTWMTAVPTMYQTMLDRAAEHADVIASSDLQLLRSSSSSLPAPVHTQLEEIFSAPVVESYGMTEATHQIASNTLTSRVAGAVGQAAGPEIAIFDDDDQPMPQDKEGRVVIRGDNVIDGYVDPEATAKAFVGGWFDTGDLGTLDAAGVLRLTGRSKEMINRGGESIAPAEIDAVLLEHPDVGRAMTFAVPDHRLGEQVAALVVANEGAVLDEAGLRRFASTRMPPTRVPRRVVFADDVPRGPTGKPRRIGAANELGLRDLDGPPSTAAPHTPPSSTVEKVLHDLWSDVLERDGFGIKDRFLDAGGDSLLAMRLLSRVSDTLDLDISIIDFFDSPTIADQAVLIEELLLA